MSDTLRDDSTVTSRIDGTTRKEAAMLRAGLATLFTISFLVAPAMGQKHEIKEFALPGECFRIELTTTVKGALKVTRDGKAEQIPIDASSVHAYLEKTLREKEGQAVRAARRYEKAEGSGKVGSETTARKIRPERSLVVAQRLNERYFCYSPAGPFTRSELEITSEHFDSLPLTGLLPGKEVEVGESWNVPNACAVALCQFDGLIGQTVKGTLKEVKDGQAIVRVVGDALGIEAGANVKQVIDATASFDLLRKRITSVEWSQTDERDQGPVSPASNLKTTISLKRQFLAVEPKELNKAALVAISDEDEPAAVLKTLAVKDLKGKYGFLHSRDWHIVSQSQEHVILRLLNRGEFIAQASLLPWEKRDAGKRIETEVFKKAIAESKAWAFEEMIDAGQVASDEDRWVYRVVAKGELDGMKVVQAYYMVVSPQGDHLLVTFTTKAGNLAKLGTRDVELVNSIEFTK